MNNLLAKYVDRAAFDELAQRYIRATGTPEPLASAAVYAVVDGGKRLRPALCYMGAAFAGAKRESADFCAAAIEFIHCYSLVHDDLPSMDNDALRRGKPTVHVKFGEGMAVLCGDFLLNLAYEILTSGITDAKTCKAARIIAECAGGAGMVGGQCLDIRGGTPEDEAALREAYAKKTSALFQGALLSGAAVGGAGDEELAALKEYAYLLGIAFQIEDDILDVTSTAEVLGKDIDSDARNDKTTYVTLFGLDGARAKLHADCVGAKQALAKYGDRAADLVKLVDLLESRAY